MPERPETSETPQLSAKTIPSLDGLRAVSIGLVLLGHGIGLGEHSFWFRAAFYHARLGVDVFFVISGYLITSLLLKEKANFGSLSLRLFYIRRSLRILPAFVVFVGSVFALNALGWTNIPSRQWIFVLTYTINFALPVAWDVGHLWSLSVEEHFYLLWPLAVRFAGIRTCVALAVTAIFAGIFIRMLYVITGYELVSSKLQFATPYVVGPIAMGCLLAMAGPAVPRTILGARRWMGPATLTAIIAILLMDAVTPGSAHRLREIVINLLLTFVVARFVFLPTGLAAACLNSRPFSFVGKLSYSLYLWQELFMNPYSTAMICRFPWNVMGSCGLACASYFMIETPFLKLRKDFRRTPFPAANAVMPSLA